ncbi:diacylglycerol kinase 5-like isoform X3 [Rosa chinensis]|uniref:diacylglycerol kinase 5-like isoform X3 n=1 Tax=Rosa chinensis TaxID=74649 RepID=UPI001AD92470|nr:diacylglycerol kinase 5-like isoform X3 [Rosa chinensis]
MSNRFLKEMYIPDELLHADLEVEPAVHIPKFPVLVFIDMKNMNNKQLGEKLLDKFRYHLNKKQVFAVLEEKSDTKKKVKAHDPERVLKDVYGTLEKLKRKGYGFADEIQKTMTVIIVGGDCVANWILGVICDLKLPELPSIAPIPLQTISLIGGSISSSFGWRSISPDDPVKLSLLDVQYAKKMKTDSRHILIWMKTIKSSTANQQIPHSLHLCHPVHEPDKQNADNLKLSGGFWNYFSLEVDALRQYGNHCFHPTERTLSSVANIKVMKQLGQWDKLDITSRPQIMKKDRKERYLFPSFIDDGHLQIIGCRDVFFPLSEGSIHLGQVRGIRFEFIDGEEEVVNMTIDGTPWENIPLDGTGITVIEITHHCQVNILAYPYCDCPPKSIHDQVVMNDASENDDENNAKDYSERHKKFGAASTFKLTCADEGLKDMKPMVKQALPTSSNR